jgi:hypothetical protein
MKRIRKGELERIGVGGEMQSMICLAFWFRSMLTFSYVDLPNHFEDHCLSLP